MNYSTVVGILGGVNYAGSFLREVLRLPSADADSASARVLFVRKNTCQELTRPHWSRRGRPSESHNLQTGPPSLLFSVHNWQIEQSSLPLFVLISTRAFPGILQ